MDPDRVRGAGAAFAAAVLLSLYVLFWPEPGASGVQLPGADKAVHAALFALLAGTARLRFGPPQPVVAAVLGYAAVSEVVQAALLSRRSGDLLDLVADGVGVAAGWLLVGRWAVARGGEGGRG